MPSWNKDFIIINSINVIRTLIYSFNFCIMWCQHILIKQPLVSEHKMVFTKSYWFHLNNDGLYVYYYELQCILLAMTIYQKEIALYVYQ